MKDYFDFLVDFSKIKGIWYKSMRKGHTGIGYTFESLLGKKENSSPLPDYNSIEIKTKRYFSRGFITLFCCSPTSPNYNISNLINKDPISSSATNGFSIGVTSCEPAFYKGLEYQLYVDYDTEKIYLLILKSFRIVDSSVYWTFESIKKRISLKLTNLIIIKTMIKKIDSLEYYNYAKSYFYKLKNPICFIKAIDEGLIKINFRLSCKKQDNQIKFYNHGVSFNIHEKNIENIFDFICYY